MPGLFTGGSPKKFVVRPSTIGGWTGDGTGIVGGRDGTGRAGDFGHVTWTSWGARRAVGRGVVWVNHCIPDCADGSFTREPPTRIVAWAPKNGHFTKLSFSYDAGNGRKKHTFTYRKRSPAWV